MYVSTYIHTNYCISYREVNLLKQTSYNEWLLPVDILKCLSTILNFLTVRIISLIMSSFYLICLLYAKIHKVNKINLMNIIVSLWKGGMVIFGFIKKIILSVFFFYYLCNKLIKHFSSVMFCLRIKV